MMEAAILVNVLMAILAYVTTDRLIGSKAIKDKFIKANLFGKDLNKTSEARMLVS